MVPHTSDLPLGPVLAPQTNAKPVALNSDPSVQFDQADTEGGPPLLDGLIVDPLVVSKGLRNGIPGTITKKGTFGLS